MGIRRPKPRFIFLLRYSSPTISLKILSFLLFTILFGSIVQSATYTWSVNSDGNWNDATKWGGSGYPNAVGDTANLTYNITTSRTVWVTADATVGTLSIDDTGIAPDQSWTLDNSSTKNLIFDVSSGSATLNSTSDDPNVVHTIKVPLQLNDNLSASVSPHTLTLSGIISGAGGLTKSGSGVLTLSGVNTFTGKTTVSGGTVRVSSQTNLGATPASFVSDQLSLSGGTLNSTMSITLSSNRGVSLGASGGTFNVDSSKWLTVQSAISGSGSLTKSGPGFLTLTGANTYTGKTFLTAGGLELSTDTRLGTPPGSFVADHLTITGNGMFNATASFTLNANRGVNLGSVGGTFVVNNGVTLTIPAVISGSGFLSTSGDGILLLTGVNTHTGKTCVFGLTLQVSQDRNLGAVPSVFTADQITLGLNGKLNTTATLTLAANRGIALHDLDYYDGTINVNSGTTLTIPGTISGACRFIKAGDGTLVVSSPNTYTGMTTVSAGTLRISADTALGSAPLSPVANKLTLNGGTLNTTSSFNLHANRGISLGTSGGTINVNSGTTLTVPGPMSGSGWFAKSGSGTLLVTGPTSYTGTTSVNAGIMRLGASDILFYGTDLGVSTGATFDLNNLSQRIDSLIGSGNITLGSGILTAGYNNGPGNFSGVISGTGSFYKSGTNTLVLSGNNTYTGQTVINTGSLILGASNRLSDLTEVIVYTYGTFDLAGYSETISKLWDWGTVTLGSGTLTVGANDAGSTFRGTISGSNGKLTKIGNGTFTLTGNNTYTGQTTVSGGTLLVTNGTGSGIGKGSVTVAAGAVLGGTGIIGPDPAKNVTINGTLSPGNGGIGTLTVGTVGGGNKVIFGTGSTFAVEVNNTNANDLLVVKGDLDLSGTETLTLSGTFASGGSYTVATYTGTLTGAFDTVTGLAPGWAVDYAIPGEIKLVRQYTLAGTVVLGDYPPGPQGLTVTVELRGSSPRAETGTLNGAGEFTIVDVEPGTYDVWIKASHWLAKLVGGVVISGDGDTDIGMIALINGDSDGDNEVTTSDLANVLYAIDALPGDPNWLPEADLDGDGEVTTSDLATVLANMDRLGD